MSKVWYQSLSEEEKEAYKECKCKESEKANRELNTSLMKLAMIGTSLVGEKSVPKLDINYCNKQ